MAQRVAACPVPMMMTPTLQQWLSLCETAG
jgi:hypothetical protein